MSFAWLKNTYNKIYLGFFLSIILVFFYTRPLNADYHKFIAGDGFGYYAYLPAQYIHNDPHYDFKWFNKVHNDNYVYCAFADPMDNFMVPYQHKKINKYYQGLSFLWTPFFMLSHVCAKAFHYKADGFSQPYQLGIGLASLCYLFLGLFYLRKLLYSFFKNDLVATLIPIFIFYGTRLFYFAINMNSESHVYSFAFITLLLYFSYQFFNQEKQQLTNLLLSLLCLTIIVCIRPLNLITLLVIPAFIPKNFKLKFSLREFNLLHLCILLICGAFLIHQFSILYTQTGTLFPYTYTEERFYFDNPHLHDVLLSYHSGWFVYVPIALVSIIGLLFLPTLKQKLVTLGFMVFIIYLYSSWWYWPIVARSSIDYHALLAIGLAALLLKCIASRKLKIASLSFLLVCLTYYQFKSMQLHNGILVENYTYKEIFWRNFFRTHKANMFLVPPESIIKQESYLQDFETDSYPGAKTETIKHAGKSAVVLTKENPFSSTFDFKYPSLFKEDGIRKIHLSFWAYFTKEITSTHMYLKFLDKDKQLVFETAFYINEDFMMKDQWDFKEFGYQIADEDLIGKKPIEYISWFIWNNEGKGELYVDDVKTDLLLTRKDFEVFK